MNPSSDLRDRWQHELNRLAWRRTPGCRSWDLVRARVLRYLLARYRYRQLPYVPEPSSAPSIMIHPLPTPRWEPRPSEQLRSTLDSIHWANQSSYAEFGLN